ncbi:hypothetical protein [Thermocrinis sp.]|uniref:hypothetical protein n=1 Tax=Thermocrinis sp. TaxID=2024383 RepID=UPI003C74C8DE
MLGAKQGCKANKPSKGAGLSYNQKLGALVLWWCGAGGVMRVLSKQDKVVKLGAGLSKQAKAWYPVRVSCIVLSKDKVGQGLGALCGSILQPKAWCLVLCGCGAGLSYIQALAWCLAWC